MAVVELPRGVPKGAQFYPGRRLYLDGSGKVVEATDPTRVTLLCGAESGIPMAQAKALGLIPEPVAPVTEEKAEEPAEDKAVKPDEDKAIKAPPKTKGK